MAGLFDYEFQLEKINQNKPPLQKLNKVINLTFAPNFAEKILQDSHP